MKLWEYENDSYAECWKKVDRKYFVPNVQNASENRPIPIGEKQTTSQPTLISNMLDKAFEKCTSCRLNNTYLRALDIGSGSGVVTALLACLIGNGKGNIVIGIDKFGSLVEQSKQNIKKISKIHKKSFAKMELYTKDVYELFKNPTHFQKFNIIYVGAEPKTNKDIGIFMNNIPKLLKKDGVAIAPIRGFLWLYYQDKWHETTDGIRFVPLETGIK